MTVYTPSMLADRWKCSEKHIRNMIERGELRAFRLGGKLLRIRGEDVEAFECQSGDLPDWAGNTVLHGMNSAKTGGRSGDVIALEPATTKRRPAAPRLDTPSLRARGGQR